jgi:hypothetical protein
MSMTFPTDILRKSSNTGDSADPGVDDKLDGLILE